MTTTRDTSTFIGYLLRQDKLLPVYKDSFNADGWFVVGHYHMLYNSIIDGPLLSEEYVRENYPEYLV